MTAPDELPNDIAELKAIIRAQQDQNARLEALVASFKKALFGAKSEKINPAQYELELEDIETAIAQVEAEIDANERTTPVRPPKQRQTNRGSLPKHLERVEVVIEPELSCSCGAERHVIGEDVSERLDIIPAQFRVIVTRRPKYACRSCEGGIAQAPAPAHIIAGGMPTEATLAHVLVSKYADHLPLYRQAQIYSRQGIDLDRSTLAAWVGKSAFELTPVYDALMADLKRSTKLFMDETPAPVLAPGRKRTKTGYFWALARDDRPWGGEDPPGVAFTYAPGRSGQYADNILKGFSGTLQVDGYAGYNRLLKRPAQDVTLAYCWAHARRKLHDVTRSSTAPVAQEGLTHIQALYRIEKDLRGLIADQRHAARQECSKPIIDTLELWLAQSRARVSAKSPTGEALKYIAKYWDGLCLFLDDGRIELDNNTVERTICPIALNRKNALFAGHDAGAQNWAVIASLIENLQTQRDRASRLLVHRPESHCKRAQTNPNQRTAALELRHTRVTGAPLTLDRVYRKTNSTTEASYCSKLAILELCGWIELSMDDIVLRGCVSMMIKLGRCSPLVAIWVRGCEKEAAITRRSFPETFQKTHHALVDDAVVIIVLECIRVSFARTSGMVHAILHVVSFRNVRGGRGVDRPISIFCASRAWEAGDQC